MSVAEHIDNFEFRKVLINELIDNDTFSREITPYIKQEYFTDKIEATVWKAFQKYYEAYNKIPNRSVLRVGIEKSSGLTSAEKEKAKEFISEKNSEYQDPEWLRDKTEEWCKLRACVNAVVESMQVLDGKSTDTPVEFLPNLLAEAVAISFNRRIGMEYLETAAERWEMYNAKSAFIPTGLKHFDEILGGGYQNKALHVWLAGPGCVHPETKIKIRKRKKPA